MSEIQWLVDMMLHCKLSADVREKFLARIGEVEGKLNRTQPMINTASSFPSVMPQPSFGMQAPSTQRLLEQQPLAAPMMPPIAPIKLPGVIDKETGSIVIDTGKGTKGLRKF
jgi:hypothetical protein